MALDRSYTELQVSYADGSIPSNAIDIPGTARLPGVNRQVFAGVVVTVRSHKPDTPGSIPGPAIWKMILLLEQARSRKAVEPQGLGFKSSVFRFGV